MYFADLLQLGLGMVLPFHTDLEGAPSVAAEDGADAGALDNEVLFHTGRS